MRYRLPSGAEALATDLKQQKEQVRYILREGQNTARLRKAPSQAPVAETPAEPIYITPACRFTSTEAIPQFTPRRMDGDKGFAWLRQRAVANQKAAI